MKTFSQRFLFKLRLWRPLCLVVRNLNWEMLIFYIEFNSSWKMINFRQTESETLWSCVSFHLNKITEYFVFSSCVLKSKKKSRKVLGSSRKDFVEDLKVAISCPWDPLQVYSTLWVLNKTLSHRCLHAAMIGNVLDFRKKFPNCFLTV